VKAYIEYYRNQVGGGASNRFEGVLYQRGHGFGSFFRGLLRFIKPVFKSDIVRSGAKALARQAAETGAQVMGDISEGQNVRQSLKQRAGEGGRQLAGTAKRKLESVQIGSGKRRRKNVSLSRAVVPSSRRRKQKKKKRSLKTVF